MQEKPEFIDDIVIPHTFYGLTIRSPIARGRLKGIEAPRMPKAVTLIKAQDIPGENRIADFPVPVLAFDELSYIGEPLALLVGPNEEQLQEYADQCRIRFDEETPVFNAALSGAVLAERKITLGNPEKAFEEAAAVVEGTYTTGIQEHWYSDTTGAAALFSQDLKNPDLKNPGQERLVIRTATQWPFHVRRSAARVLQIPEGLITVKPARIGFHLDGKLWYPSLIACQAALGALITRKPVKMILRREEDFRYSPKRGSAEITVRSALGKEGRILGTEVKVCADLGAYGVFTDEILDRICLGALGSYGSDALTLQGRGVSTAIPPAGPLGGFGLAQGFFAMERQVSQIADSRREDPAEWRKDHSLHRNMRLALGTEIKDPVPMEQLLDTTESISDYRRKWASNELLRYRRREDGWEERGPREPLRGIGIAAAYQGSSFLHNENGSYGVELTLEKDGSLEIRTSMVSSTEESIRPWQNIAGEILGVEAGAVRVVSDSTDGIPDSGPASLSRNITVVTKLVERACTAIRKQHFRDPLPITVRRFYHPAKGLDWEGKSYDQNAFAALSWGAAVVEVEIDPVEYTPLVRGIWLGIDGGAILSEDRARKALTFGAIQALGWASRERLAYTGGVIPDSQIREYPILAPRDIPPIHIDFLWSDSASPKGIGELPFNCIPAAYVQAVSQAMDHPFMRLPINAREIWEVIKSREREESL
ncbi:aldehyde oxidase [Spirochaetia bacterium]|nr:aldehyde oxidase [Spirochaetia bacterium]